MSSSTAPRWRESTSGVRDAPGPDAGELHRLPAGARAPVQATYVAPFSSATGCTGASRDSAPLRPQRRSSVRVVHFPAPSADRRRRRGGRRCPRSRRRARCARAAPTGAGPGSTAGGRSAASRSISPPAGWKRAARRVPARQTSTRSPRALIATAAVLPSARSRARRERLAGLALGDAQERRALDGPGDDRVARRVDRRPVVRRRTRRASRTRRSRRRTARRR